MNMERSLEIRPVELKRLLADVFILSLQTKNFHGYMRGSHFRIEWSTFEREKVNLFKKDVPRSFPSVGSQSKTCLTTPTSSTDARALKLRRIDEITRLFGN